MSLCAYCDTECSPSREHIIPNFLYDYLKENGGHTGWNERAEKIIDGESKIKDVCGICNNERLGLLDSYGKKFMEEAGVFIDNFLYREKLVKYEYDLLVRWLLKLSYNSARAAKNNEQALSKYRKYIIAGQNNNIVSGGVYLLAGIVNPAKLSNKEIEDYASQLPISEDGYSNPFYVRISWVPPFVEQYYVRSVVLGALVFHLIIFDSGIKIGFRRAAVKKWVKQNPGMAIIEPSKAAINLKRINRSFLDLQSMQLTRLKHRKAAEDLLKKAGKGRS